MDPLGWGKTSPAMQMDYRGAHFNGVESKVKNWNQLMGERSISVGNVCGHQLGLLAGPLLAYCTAVVD